MRKLIVTTRPEDFSLPIPGVEVVTAKDYLTGDTYIDKRDMVIYNLCRSYRYQSAGYYVSLLAEARGHRAIPSVTTIQDIKSQSIIRCLTDDIDHLIQRSLSHITSKDFTLSVYFGHNISPRYDRLCRALYGLFEAPLLRAEFVYHRSWQLQNITPISVKEVPESHLSYMAEFAGKYFAGRKFYSSHRSRLLYDLAILVDPQEKAPPSDERALKRFARAAEEAGMNPDIIARDDIADIEQYDGLFIRATTAVNNHTYRFARKAWAEGLAVIDDPLSIARCTNKVYLAELLGRARIPAPRTLVVHKDNAGEIGPTLGFPFVLKQPDSSFSQGVVKVSDAASLDEALESFFEKSDFVVAQEYMPTEFDWRIGILDRKPLFACKYFMARNHWQVYNWSAAEKSSQEGKWETFPVEEAPADAVKTALRAANLIGDGFYGVDLKQQGKQFFAIEVNDNPSVESGVEDAVLKERLYETVMHVFLERIRKAHGRMAGNGDDE